MKDIYIKNFSGHSLAKTSLIQNGNTMFVRKEVSDTDELGIAKLEKQYQWLSDIFESFPATFPRVLSSRKDKAYFAYHMEYSPWQSLSDLVRFGHIDAHNAQNIISSVASFCFENLFYARTSSIPHKNYIFSEIILKLKKRIEKSELISKEFKEFNEAPIFCFNGRTIRNSRQVFDSFQDRNVLKQLKPQMLGCVHGDLTFANILTDGKAFLLIDPRGEGADSYFYDIGKLYQSMACDLEGMLRKEHEVMIKQNGLVHSFSKSQNNPPMNEDEFFSFWKEKPYISAEPNWKAKILFFAAAHFIGAVPFRLYAKDLETAILFYVQGLDLLERVIRDITIQNEQVRKSRIIQEAV